MNKMSILIACCFLLPINLPFVFAADEGYADHKKRDTKLQVDTFLLPPMDENMGALYREAIDLLARTRDLPTSVRLRPKTALQKDDLQEELEKDEEHGWITIATRPVVSKMHLARVYVKAGEYERAAELYRRLAGRYPRSIHFRAMWIACRRINGATFEEIEREILSDWQLEDFPHIDWIRKVDEMGSAFAKGGKQ